MPEGVAFANSDTIAGILALPAAMPPSRHMLQAGRDHFVPSIRLVLLNREPHFSQRPPLTPWKPDACRDIRLRFGNHQTQISAIEVSLTLFSAADKNCADLVTELLDHGASVDARDRFGARPLSHAARFGHLPVVDLLLARGAPIDARNLAGATALYLAVEGDRAPVAQRLIEKGANINLAGRGGVTPVSAAAYRGNDALVEALLAHGADDRAADETGKPPIVYARPAHGLMS